MSFPTLAYFESIICQISAWSIKNIKKLLYLSIWIKKVEMTNSAFRSAAVSMHAYKDKHSTETALIKVQNDNLSALDTGTSAILLMLDLSAAFDTIDHDIL